MRKAIGIPDHKLFESITNIKIGATEVFQRAGRKEQAGASPFGGLGDREPQLDAGAEELAQDADHLGSQLASYPVLSKLAMYGEMELVAVKRDEANRLDPHLKNGF